MDHYKEVIVALSESVMKMCVQRPLAEDWRWRHIWQCFVGARRMIFAISSTVTSQRSAMLGHLSTNNLRGWSTKSRRTYCIHLRLEMDGKFFSHVLGFVGAWGALSNRLIFDQSAFCLQINAKKTNGKALIHFTSVSARWRLYKQSPSVTDIKVQRSAFSDGHPSKY